MYLQNGLSAGYLVLCGHLSYLWPVVTSYKSNHKSLPQGNLTWSQSCFCPCKTELIAPVCPIASVPWDSLVPPLSPCASVCPYLWTPDTNEVMRKYLGIEEGNLFSLFGAWRKYSWYLGWEIRAGPGILCNGQLVHFWKDCAAFKTFPKEHLWTDWMRQPRPWEFWK